MLRLIAYAIFAGLLAGVLDIIYVCSHYSLSAHVPPERILQAVAGGLIGNAAAYSGGMATAVLGLALHLKMTVVMALIYMAATRFVPALNKAAILSGLAYGLGLYAVMNYIVVPLSAAGNGVPNPPQGEFFIGALLAHAFLVGAPIALVCKVAARS